MLISSESLTQWAMDALCAFDTPSVEAEVVARALVKTSLWGIDSHGIARLPHYLNRIEHGSINPKPNLQFNKTNIAVGQVDGDDGLGILVSSFAMRNAIQIAVETGIGVVGVKNSSHCGAIGLYTRQATEAGMVGIGFTHSDSLALPFGGKQAYFGTNPISIAIPRAGNPEEPLCIDMATSIVPWNRIMNARTEGREVPHGWGVDRHGVDSTNPKEIVAVKSTAEHKGFALAFLIDMLCGPMNGMPFGQRITPMYSHLEEKRSLGSLFIALNPSSFVGNVVSEAIEISIADLRSQGDQIMFPGEPEYIAMRKRAKEGIPVDPGLMKEFEYWTQKLNTKPVGQ